MSDPGLTDHVLTVVVTCEDDDLRALIYGVTRGLFESYEGRIVGNGFEVHVYPGNELRWTWQTTGAPMPGSEVVA